MNGIFMLFFHLPNGTDCKPAIKPGVCQLTLSSAFSLAAAEELVREETI